jgi:hypothetical protein
LFYRHHLSPTVNIRGAYFIALESYVIPGIVSQVEVME